MFKGNLIDRAKWLFVGILFLFAVGCSVSDNVVSEPSSTPTEKTDSRRVAPSMGSSPFQGHFGKATASLEERIFIAEVVVKARLLTAGQDVLNFRAVSYLKGTGPTEFTVRAVTEGRNTQWDNQDAILFLEDYSQGPETFTFIDTTEWDYMWEGYSPTEYTGDLPEGYTPGRDNPVWLPVDPPRSLVSNAAQSSDSSANIRITSELGRSGDRVKVTQQKLESQVQWIAGTTPAREGESAAQRSADPETHRKCVIAALEIIRDVRDAEIYLDEDLLPVDGGSITLKSGLPEDSILLDFSDEPAGGYIPHVFHGSDAHLFKSYLMETGDKSRVYFEDKIVTARPLPAGNYVMNKSSRPHWLEPCRFRSDEMYMVHNVRVVAPNNVLYESFFDPGLIPEGIGYSSDGGVLKAGSSSSKTIEIAKIVSRSGQVQITVNSVEALDRTVMDFIDLDGSVTLSLNSANATSSNAVLTWDVSSQPWQDGDKLMLRITRILPSPILDAQLTVQGFSPQEPGYFRDLTGNLEPGEFQFNGSTIRISSFYWLRGTLRFLTENHADLTGHVILVLDSDGAKVLELAIDDAQVLVAGSNYAWNVPRPWDAGDVLRMIIQYRT